MTPRPKRTQKSGFSALLSDYEKTKSMFARLYKISLSKYAPYDYIGLPL